MDKNVLKNFEYNLKEYLQDTIYNPEKLMVELPENKWFKINPTRGINQGIECYDLSSVTTLLSNIMNNVYGENEYNRILIENQTMRFLRRGGVAAGGALYPNNIYIIRKIQDEVYVYQYNPSLNLLHYISKRKSDNSELDSNCCYFVVTNYYWRNWLKYRYFGYRLMLVDAGYLLSNLSMIFSENNIPHDIIFSSGLFNTISKCLDIDLKFEATSVVISTKDDFFVDSIDNLKKNKVNYKLHDDWDILPLGLYEMIEKKVEKEKFDVFQTVNNLRFPYWFDDYKYYRISPGGGPMISISKISDKEIKSTLKLYCDLKKRLSELCKDIVTYAYVNNIDNIQKGLYLVKEDGTFEKKECKHNAYEFQMILKKNNFNLYDSPAFLFFGTRIDLSSSNYNFSDFKIKQIQIGFASHLFTFAACQYKSWTHPILGFDVELSEKLIGIDDDLKLLNLVVLSNSKDLERFSIDFNSINFN